MYESYRYLCRGRPRHRQGHLITYVADSIGCVQIALPPQVLLHGDGGCPVVLGRHDGLVAHYAGRGILAHGGGRMGEEEENELNELAGWKTRKIEKSKKGVENFAEHDTQSLTV